MSLVQPYYVMDQHTTEKVQRIEQLGIKTFFIMRMLKEVISTITCLQMAKRRNVILVSTNNQYIATSTLISPASVLQYQFSITRGHCYKIYKPHT